jgi:hypothetical protein
MPDIDELLVSMSKLHLVIARGTEVPRYLEPQGKWCILICSYHILIKAITKRNNILQQKDINGKKMYDTGLPTRQTADLYLR